MYKRFRLKATVVGYKLLYNTVDGIPKYELDLKINGQLVHAQTIRNGYVNMYIDNSWLNTEMEFVAHYTPKDNLVIDYEYYHFKKKGVDTYSKKC